MADSCKQPPSSDVSMTLGADSRFDVDDVTLSSQRSLVAHSSVFSIAPAATAAIPNIFYSSNYLKSILMCVA